MRSIYQFTISCLILLFSNNTNAQYSNVRNIEEGTDQDFEIIEDLNNDGILDAVLNGILECSGGEYFRIYHGKIDDITGEYIFELVHTSFQNHGFFFYLMDMNGDGHKAVLSQQTGNGNITISRYENGQYKDYLLEDPDIDLNVMTDIDNDGIDENIRRKSNVFYRGNFDEDFNYVESVYLTKEVNSILPYDYNQDGILDYLYFENDYLHILLIDGGLIEEIVIPENDLTYAQADERLFFDVDQNGDVDYLFRPNSSGGGLGDLFIAWNIGQNGFDEVEVIAKTIPLENDETFQYLDLDLDGKEELIIKDFSDPDKDVFKDAKTGDEVVYEYADEFDSYDHFSTQGASQIVVASNYKYEVQQPRAIIEYKYESGEFVGREIPIIIPGYSSVKDAVKTDLNQDGKIDLLFSAYGSSDYGEKTSIRWISNIDGPEQNNSNAILGNLENLTNTIFLDIDADGDTDIVSARDLTIYYNDGLGAFSYSKEIEIGAKHNAKIEYGDVNNDGLFDLLLLRKNEDLIVYKNIDGETFEASIVGTYDSGSEIGFYHVDKDQNIDIVVLQNSVYTMMNDGNGNFSSSYYSNVAFTSHLFFHDIDQDGDIEYILESFGEVIMLDFNEEFVLDLYSPVLLFVGTNFQNYNLFDVDKDGDLDLLTTGNSNDDINWYEVVKPDSVISRGALNSFLIMPDDPYLFNSPYLEEYDQFVIGKCGKLYITQPEVESINICVYADSNADNTLDIDDYPLTNYAFSIKSGGINSVLNSGESGCVNVQLHADTYIFNSVGEACFSFVDEEVVVDQSTDLINLLAIETGYEGSVKIDLTSAPTRCGFTVEHWLTVRNETCNSDLGTIELTLDDISLWNTISSEQEFFQFEKNLTFDITNLRPGESITYKWTMEIPDFTFTGQFLDHEVRVLDINLSQLANHKYTSEIRCAIDPNDKSISPDRSSEFGESYITDETLTYLIRFQNVGNDTAINIVVRDTLSIHLDIDEFQNIRTSHTCNYTLDTLSRIIQFNFDDIRLVDSLTNERESHGFVKFDIRAEEGLFDYDPIYNSAGIYFDFNPPIVTNTVETKYVHDLSILTSINNAEFGNEIIVNPNPASHFINISGLPEHQVSIELFSSSGQKIYSNVSKGRSDYTVDTSTLGSGLYFLKIFDGDKSKLEKIVIHR